MYVKTKFDSESSYLLWETTTYHSILVTDILIGILFYFSDGVSHRFRVCPRSFLRRKYRTEQTTKSTARKDILALDLEMGKGKRPQATAR